MIATTVEVVTAVADAVRVATVVVVVAAPTVQIVKTAVTDAVRVATVVVVTAAPAAMADTVRVATVSAATAIAQEVVSLQQQL